jgi:glycosyltransferase involved in cell wall biosynthesis
MNRLRESDSSIKIILISIIKNESSIIRRCLDALLPIVDGFCICDTGSTDNTLQILHQYHRTVAEPARKVFHVARHDWRNFGHNRTISFDECRNWISANFPHWFLNNVWGLLVDADMLLRVENISPLRQLLEMHQNTSTSQFQILQKSDRITYWNTRLIRMSANWVCRGVTHEFWESLSGGSINKISDNVLWIDDRNDGGCKADKHARDVRLLEEGIADSATNEPLRARYYFYLANTYFAMGNKEKAIEYYDRRIAAGGWIEEIWFSQYHKYTMTKSQEDLWRSVECMPQRLECIYHYFKNKRIRGEKYTQEDYGLGAIGYSFLKKKDPREIYLFMEHDVYTWKFLDEFGLVCYYTNHRVEGKEITEKLLTMRDKMGEGDYSRIVANMRFY